MIRKIKKINSFIFILFTLMFWSCDDSSSQNEATGNNELPIYGHKEFIEGIDKDTVYHTIPYWAFINQDGEYVGTKDYQGKPYVAYFFFSHCPQICPKIHSNMVEFQKQTKGLDFNVIAYTVDPERDSVERLKFYAEEYGFDLSNYNFVTGNQKDIYELGVNGYLVPNSQDALAPGGFLHSEKLMLIDSKMRIRGYYEGTETKEVNQLVNDLQKLIKDESSN